MEVIYVNLFIEIPKYFTGIVKWKSPKKWIWYLKDGELHRTDGPAMISPYHKEWYYEDVRMTPMEVFDKLTDEEREKVIWNLDEWK